MEQDKSIYVLPVYKTYYKIKLGVQGIYYEKMNDTTNDIYQDKIVEYICSNIKALKESEIINEIINYQKFIYNGFTTSEDAYDRLINKSKEKNIKDQIDELARLRSELYGSSNGEQYSADDRNNNSSKGKSLVLSNGNKKIDTEAAFVNALLLAFIVEAVGFIMLTAIILKAIA